MDEHELDEYLSSIDFLDTRLGARAPDDGDDLQLEYLRDERGIRMPGCYRVRPTPSY